MIHPLNHRRFTLGFLVVVAGLALGVVAPGLAQAQPGQSNGQPFVDDPASRLKDEDDARLAPDAPSRSMLAAAMASGDTRVDALVSGFKWPLTTITYSFYDAAVFAGSYYGTETGVREVSEAVKTNVRAVMAWMETLMNVDFVEVTESPSNVGLVRFMLSNNPSYAYAYYPSSTQTFHVAGDVHLNPNYDRLGDTNGFQHPAGKHGYLTLIHELGHAIGLKHPHDSTPNLPSGDDSHTNTVMSYNFYGASPGTPMYYDLMALHYLYGAKDKNTGNDIYAFTRGLDQYGLGSTLVIDTPYVTKQAVWDSAGFDTIDLTAIPFNSGGYRVDLRAGGWLTSNASYRGSWYDYGTSLGPGALVRQLVTSSSADTVYANGEANTFGGYRRDRMTGADIIYLADASDTLDLSGYLPSEVTETPSGNDLLIGLGANGSVLLKDYNLGYRPAISYSAAVPRFSVSDTSVTEGNAGSVAAVFTVSLSAPAAAALSVGYATQAGAATSGDFVATSGTLTFAPGETTKPVTVMVVGDTAIEADETFFLVLSNPSSGAEIGDADATCVIRNDDAAANQPPVAAASATPTSGAAPLAVNFSSAGSSDPDGSIASYAWSFGDGASGSGPSPAHTYAAEGTYTAVLTVTDNLGATASKSVTIVVSADPSKVMSATIQSLVIVAASGGAAARATVVVRDGAGHVVPGALVNAEWGGLVRGRQTATTAADGSAAITSKATKKKGTITFTVAGVAKSGYAFSGRVTASVTVQ